MPRGVNVKIRPRAALGAGVVVLALAASAQPAPAKPGKARVDALLRGAVAEHGVKAAIVQVTVGGRRVMTKAYGESQDGEPATTRMRFRNGTVATSHMATLLLRLAERGRVDLDDKVSKWLPDLPGGKRVTLRMLAGMSGGYHDYAIDPRTTEQRYARPFRAISTARKLDLALDLPRQFRAGSNFSYSHSDYVILGLALEKITGLPLDVALRRQVLRPLRLRQTVASQTAAIPRPALHAFTAERRAFLGIPRGTVFLEDATAWNPAWMLARGAIQTSSIRDLTRTAIGVGTGRLLSKRSHRLQVDGRRGFGHPRPGCARCTRLSPRFGYGLGVERNGAWIMERSMQGGYAVIGSYLPKKRISVALVLTFRSSAFDAIGNLRPYWTQLHARIGKALAPGNAPLRRPAALMARVDG
jgi:CubicO group peptidase (beta-lactamase class C family)